MNIYVETNFILELTFLQEESKSCETILSICESKKEKLIIPAFSLVEPVYRLYLQEKARQEIQNNLKPERDYLRRSAASKEKFATIKDLENLLAQSINEDKARFENQKNRIINIAEVIPLDSDIVRKAIGFEKKFDLSPQDAVIYTSIVSHLSAHKSKSSYFFTRDRKGFATPEIRESLENLNCVVSTSFNDGLVRLKFKN